MNEQLLREKLTRLADAPGQPDEHAAWTAITDGIDRDRRRTAVRRAGRGIGGATLVAAAAVIVFALSHSSDRQAVKIVPPASDSSPASSTPTTAVVTHTGLPAQPVLVAVTDDAGIARLDVYDGATGRFWSEGAHGTTAISSFNSAAVGPDGRIYYAEETGDTTAIKSVDPYSGAPAEVAFGLDGEVQSPVFDPQGTTMAYGISGVATEGTRIGLVDLATGEKRVLDFSDHGARFRTESGGIYYVEFTPDGTGLWFRGNRPESEVWSVRADASDLHEAGVELDRQSAGKAGRFHFASAGGELVFEVAGAADKPLLRTTQQRTAVDAVPNTENAVSFDADPATGEVIVGFGDGRLEKRSASGELMWSVTVAGTPSMVFV